MSFLTLFVIICSGYVFLVRMLRYRNLEYIRERVAKLKSSPNGVTPSEAQKLILISLLLDMPTLCRLGIQLALFKSYGIVSFSTLWPFVNVLSLRHEALCVSASKPDWGVNCR